MRYSRYETNADAVDHLVLECGAHGYSRTQMAACIGISRGNLMVWAKRFPRFADVLERADTLAQAWWEGRAMDGSAQNRIGQSVWHKSMAARFPREYADRLEQGGIGDGEKIERINWTVVDVPEAKK